MKGSGGMSRAELNALYEIGDMYRQQDEPEETVAMPRQRAPLQIGKDGIRIFNPSQRAASRKNNPSPQKKRR